MILGEILGIVGDSGFAGIFRKYCSLVMAFIYKMWYTKNNIELVREIFMMAKATLDYTIGIIKVDIRLRERSVL